MITNNITVHVAHIADAHAARSFYETDYPTLHSLIAAYCLDRWPSHMPTDVVIPPDDAKMIELFFETKENHGDTLHESSMTFPLPPPFSSALDMLAALSTIERFSKGLLHLATPALPGPATPPDYAASLRAIHRCGQLLHAVAGEAIAAAATPAKPLSTESTTPRNHDPDIESGQPAPSGEPVPPR